jgi:hypothetical protein
MVDRSRQAGTQPRLIRGYWERGTRAERRKRVEDAIRSLGEVMQSLEHFAVADSGGILESKKEPRWEFSP